MLPVSREIYEGCLQKDRRCQQRLYEHCYPEMMKVCLRYSHHLQDAASLYNESMLKVFEKISTVNQTSLLPGWIMKTVLHTCIDFCRKKVKYVVLKSEFQEDYEPTIPPAVYEKISAAETLALLKDLPASTSLVFNLFAIDGYRHDEIAEMLGISTGTSKWHVSEARRQLRDKLINVSKSKTFSHVI